MAFDLNAYRAAHLPWKFTAGARTWTARHVSATAIMASQARSAAAVRAGRGEGAQLAELRRLLRLAFPWRFSYLTRGDPVAVIMALEPSARKEAFADFFACLEGKTTRAATFPSQTNTTRSSARTSTRTA